MMNATDDDMYSPLSTTECEEIIREPIDFTNPYTGLLLGFGLIGSIGNAMVIGVIVSSKSLRSKMTYKLVCNLACADFIASLFMIPRPDVLYDQSIAMRFVCRVYGSDFPLWMSFVVSVMALLMMALDRYWAIVTPLRYQTIVYSKKRYLLLVFPWVAGVLIQGFCIIVRDVDECGKCKNFYNWEYALPLVGSSVFIFSYLIPITCMMFVYYKIIQGMATMAKNMVTYKQDQSAKKLEKTKTKMVWVFFGLTVFFTITWGPDQFLYLSYTMGASVYKGTVYNKLIVLIAYANSIINPLVYAFTQKTVRKKLGIDCKKKRRRDQTAYSIDNNSSAIDNTSQSRMSNTSISSI
ncbi:galanin receptor 2a-like [Antedon mediterranea]|uniref:galanin receptor 2a-like n=1 Tax=Antedon mediterranea TaxID=105859 RepID=UPI003AF823B3